MCEVPYYHVTINDLSAEETITFCENCLDSNENKSIFFLNAHCFNVSLKDDEYLTALKKCDLLLNDGVGIKIGAKLIGKNFKENMNGTDFIPHILALAARRGKKVFLLGSEDGIAEKAKREIELRIPNINILGYESGYFGPEKEEEILNRLKCVDILIVGMGVPRQEKWVHTNRNKLSNIKVIVAGGAIIDFYAGKFPRAPKILQKRHMEWIYRMAMEPRRLFKRYALGNFKFLSHVLLCSLKLQYDRLGRK